MGSPADVHQHANENLVAPVGGPACWPGTTDPTGPKGSPRQADVWGISGACPQQTGRAEAEGRLESCGIRFQWNETGPRNWLDSGICRRACRRSAGQGRVEGYHCCPDLHQDLRTGSECVDTAILHTQFLDLFTHAHHWSEPSASQVWAFPWQHSARSQTWTLPLTAQMRWTQAFTL